MFQVAQVAVVKLNVVGVRKWRYFSAGAVRKVEIAQAQEWAKENTEKRDYYLRKAGRTKIEFYRTQCEEMAKLHNDAVIQARYKLGEVMFSKAIKPVWSRWV